MMIPKSVWPTTQCVLLLFCLCNHYYCITNDEQFVGDECTVERSRSRGTCKLVTDCPDVINEIVHRAISPTSCGFIGDKQIVCCPNTRGRTTKPPTVDPISTRISQIKCEEYQKQQLEEEQVPSSIGYQRTTPKQNDCRIVRSGFLIESNTAATIKEFPHTALIGYQSGGKISWNCSGTLISDQFVLTAAQCIYPNSQLGPAQFVRFGDSQIDAEGDDSQPLQVDIVERIKHPNFDPSSLYHDIALVRLERRITFNRYIRPACLADQFEMSSPRAFATGYGYELLRQDPLLTLLKDTQEFYSYHKCNEVFEGESHERIVERSQICAASVRTTGSYCHLGDIGGSLLEYHPHQDCMFQVVGVGVTLLFKECNLPAHPRIYTRVFNYLDWIERIVWHY